MFGWLSLCSLFGHRWDWAVSNFFSDTHPTICCYRQRCRRCGKWRWQGTRFGGVRCTATETVTAPACGGKDDAPTVYPLLSKV